jgi:hypothetical protein
MPLEANEEVLRAMASLNASNDPNWLTVKRWMAIEQARHERLTSFGVDITMEAIRGLQFLTRELFNFVYWAENAKGELEILQRKKATIENQAPIQGV